IVTRHLAILAMTGAGKSWAARRLVEELASKNYPIVIFDPHGDYSGLAEVPALRGRVRRYYAKFPLFDEDADTVAEIVNSLGYPLSDTMRTRFADVFQAATRLYVDDDTERAERVDWLAGSLGREDLRAYGIQRDMWLIGHVTAAGQLGV